MGRPGLHRLRLGMFLGVGLIAAALAFGADAAGILQSQEQATVDVRFSIRGPHAAPKNIVIVQIDDVTFNDLHFLRLPRALHAKVIDRLHQDGAKVIAYDIQFTERTDDKNDNALIAAVGYPISFVVCGLFPLLAMPLVPVRDDPSLRDSPRT